MVLVTAHHPRDVSRILVDATLEKTCTEKIWKHKHFKTSQPRSVRIQISP